MFQLVDSYSTYLPLFPKTNQNAGRLTPSKQHPNPALNNPAQYNNFITSPEGAIDLFHNGGLLIYSYIGMIIAFLTSLACLKYKRILTFKRGQKG